MSDEETPPHEYDRNEILEPLLDELNARLERRPSAKDRLAIRTALAKAIARGHARGMAFASQEVEFPDFADAEVDLWAEKYPERTDEAPPEKPPEVGAAVRDLADALGNTVASAAQELAKLIRGPGDR